MRNRFLIIITASFFGICACKQHPVADHIYFNAKIWTGDSLNPESKAIAIRDSIILYVGDDYQSYAGTSTTMTDLKGKMLVPGFIDNHTHFLEGGYFLANINLRNVKSINDFISTFIRFADSAKEINWIKGGNWDHEAWGGNLPTKDWIDSVSYGHPVFVSRYDGHMGLANSIA